MTRHTWSALATAAALAIAHGAFAQGYPNKPIRLVVPFTPGSATDIIGRAAGDRVAASVGQPVIVENRPGAGGTIGTGQVAKAAPDGYTLVVVSSGHVTNPVLYGDKITYELKDLTGVIPLGSLPSVLIASPQSGIKSARELVDTLKARPGQLNFASAGVGSAAHVNAEKFKASLGFDAVHVPLKGTPEILLEVASGRVQFAFVPLVSSVGPIRDGKVVPLGVSTPKRSPTLPDVPTMAEAGYPGGEYNFWVGVLAPAGTPRDVVDRLHAEFAQALGSPEVRERFAKIGAVPMPMSPAEFDATILKEANELGPIMKAAGIKAG
ncbi:MAG: tripartite tricarboxylate transporter substrate binding protein [Burkholderiales bacterium]